MQAAHGDACPPAATLVCRACRHPPLPCAHCPLPRPPLGLCSNYMNVKAVREQQERYREYVKEQQRRQADPLYG